MELKLWSTFLQLVFTEVVPTVDRVERGLISNRYTVTTRMISALGSDVSHVNVSLTVLGKVTEQSPQITFFFLKRRVSRSRESNLRPFAYQLSADQMDSQASSNEARTIIK